MHMPSKDQLAQLVRDRRVELGLTQLELAIASGVSESTIRSIEVGGRGRRPQARTLRDLSQALGWTPDSLRTGEPQSAGQFPAWDGMTPEEKLDWLEREVAELKAERGNGARRAAS